MFEHLREREALVRALIGQRSAALDLVHATLAELVTDLLTQHAPGAQTPHVLTAEHIVGSFLAVSRWWLNNPAALSAAEVDAAFQRLMTGKELGMAP